MKVKKNAAWKEVKLGIVSLPFQAKEKNVWLKRAANQIKTKTKLIAGRINSFQSNFIQFKFIGLIWLNSV